MPTNDSSDNLCVEHLMLIFIELSNKTGSIRLHDSWYLLLNYELFENIIFGLANTRPQSLKAPFRLLIAYMYDGSRT